MQVILSIIVAFSCIFLTCNAGPCNPNWNTAPYVQCAPHYAAQFKHLTNANPSDAETLRKSLARNGPWNGGYSWESGINTVFFNSNTVTFYEEEIGGECYCYGDRDVVVGVCTNVPIQANLGRTPWCRANPTTPCRPGPFHMVTGHLEGSYCPGPPGAGK